MLENSILCDHESSKSFLKTETYSLPEQTEQVRENFRQYRLRVFVLWTSGFEV